jgi:hypothetical protein
VGVKKGLIMIKHCCPALPNIHRTVSKKGIENKGEKEVTLRESESLVSKHHLQNLPRKEVRQVREECGQRWRLLLRRIGWRGR